jgi:transposase
MIALPNLDHLSHAQKDELIVFLFARVQEQAQQIEKLLNRIEALEARLGQNSRNSGKPPSSDGLSKPAPKSRRQAGQRPSGGQKGHAGKTLERRANPDQIVIHEVPATCDACQQALPTGQVLEARQVFELPTLRHEVIEHRQMQVRCTCGKEHRGRFPAEVKHSVQYGPRALAAMVHLNQHHMVPLKRTSELMQEMYGLRVSEATVYKAAVQAHHRLKPTVQAIAEALIEASVAHADETGLRIQTTTQWLHTVTTASLTWMGCHAKRGTEAFEALGILFAFKGILVHDGWKPYQLLACLHSLCNAHHLRELTAVYEQAPEHQAWAKDLIDLLVQACEQSKDQQVSVSTQAHWRYVYDLLLEQAEQANPRQDSQGRRGRVKQSKAFNLIARLKHQAVEVWRFASDPQVPFTNNLAEQAIRMTKIKQKVSGCFRTQEGADVYCTIRSYLSTMRKQGQELFEALVQTFNGSTPLPSFNL